MFSMKNKLSIVIIIFGVILSVGIGFIIGFFSSNRKENEINKYYQQLIQTEDDKFNEILINEVNSENIKTHLRIMTNKSHMAGTEGDLESANYVYNTWISQNLDYVKKIDYNVLLSYPDPNQPNSLTIKNENGEYITKNITESYFDPEIEYSYIPKPFLAYGLNGSHTSNKVYYLNYCTQDDYKLFETKKINLTDSIIICRYGKIFRGNKAKFAEQYKAKAILIYEDPIRGAPSTEKVYPDGEFLPGDGMQRGTLYTGNGDPLTPFYPSTKDAFRITEKDNDELANIIAQVIGYDYAKEIFEMMDENEIVENENWRGGLNVKYTYGGILKKNQQLTVNVYNKREILKTYNVVGVIKGATEPDRYIMLGNHRDAWVLGAIDPTSGTASLLETSRVLSELKKSKGWVPKRSIVFLSWGAEEYGLIGSYEWVEEFQKKLSENGVIYLNVDAAVTGNYSFIALATPSLFDLIYNVTKTVKLNDKETVFDRWRDYEPHEDGTKPKISGTLGSGSDFSSFQQRVGLACIDATYIHNEFDPKYELLSYSYATYHSSFETFRLVSEFIDPEFKIFKAFTTVIAELVRRLSDSLILPFNFNDYTVEMKSMYSGLNKTYGPILNKNGIQLDGLYEAINKFARVTENFHKRLRNIDKTRINEIRQYNDQIKNLEKSFLDPIGISRNGYLHLLSAPSSYNQYGGENFPILSDAIFEAIKTPTVENWKIVEKQLSLVIYVIYSACSIIDEPIKFERDYFE